MQKGKVQVDKEKILRVGEIMFLSASKLDSLHVAFTNCLEETRPYTISAKSCGMTGDGARTTRVRRSLIFQNGNSMTLPKKPICYQMTRKHRITPYFLPSIPRSTKNPAKYFHASKFLGLELFPYAREFRGRPVIGGEVPKKESW